MSLSWKLNEKDGTLCADGYPIRIRRGGMLNFTLECDGPHHPESFFTLHRAKAIAESWAAELDEFEPVS